jgi:hypothetical protein
VTARRELSRVAPTSACLRGSVFGESTTTAHSGRRYVNVGELEPCHQTPPHADELTWGRMGAPATSLPPNTAPRRRANVEALRRKSARCHQIPLRADFVAVGHDSMRCHEPWSVAKAIRLHNL